MLLDIVVAVLVKVVLCVYVVGCGLWLCVDEFLMCIMKYFCSVSNVCFKFYFAVM